MNILKLCSSASLVLAFMLLGCTGTPPNHQETGVVGGAALGAGLGAIVGNQLGSTGGGAAVGAVTGGVVGGLVGSKQDDIEDTAEERELLLRKQQREFERQQREINNLKRQKYYDRRLDEFQKSSDKTDRSSNRFSRFESPSLQKNSYNQRLRSDSPPPIKSRKGDIRARSASRPKLYDEGKPYQGSVYEDDDLYERKY